MYKQSWDIKKIFCYLLYRFIAKHISSDFLIIGKCGQSFRRLVCRPLLKKAGKIISIGRGVNFDNGCFLEMDEYSNIGDEAILTGPYGKIKIGKNVMMGRRCVIISQNHDYREEHFEGFKGKPVHIKENAWLGHNVTILPGVTIGKHAIIGAGSVVPKSVPDYAIAVGNPAKVVKFRKQSE